MTRKTVGKSVKVILSDNGLTFYLSFILWVQLSGILKNIGFYVGIWVVGWGGGGGLTFGRDCQNQVDTN
jgi:hypothetical protein